MKIAWDVLAQRDVSAGQLSDRDRDRYYTCPRPECRKEVQLFKGRINAPYFAHLRGQGSPLCDLYHPSDGVGGSTPASYGLAERTQSEEKEYSGVELFFNYDERRNWFFYLRLPRSDSNLGFVRLNLGLDQSKKIPLSALSRTFKRFSFVPSSPDVGIRSFSADVPASYRAKASPSQASLNWDGISAFHANQMHRHRTRAARLYWGMEYFFAYRSALGLTLPAALKPTIEQSKHGWTVAHVTLPEHEDRAIEEWLRLHGNLPLGTRTAELFLLSPSAMELHFRNTVHIVDGKPLILNLHRKAFAEAEATLWVETESGPVTLRVDDRNNQLILVKLQQSDRHIYARFGNDPGALLFLDRSRLEESRAGFITVEFEAVANRSHEQVPLHSILCHKRLRACRQGLMRIRTIESNATYAGRLRSRVQNELHWRDENIVIAGGQHINQALVGRLQALLKNPSVEISIELEGGISQYIAARASVGKSFGFSDTLRWLLAQYPKAWTILNTQPLSQKAVLEVLSRLEVTSTHEVHKAYLLNELITQCRGI